jgi:hypothetical protein
MRPETNEQECTEVTKMLRNRKKDRGRVLVAAFPVLGCPRPSGMLEQEVTRGNREVLASVYSVCSY